METIGQSVPKKESPDKVSGAAMYTADRIEARMLHARYVISPYAHARIAGVDAAEASRMPGVRAIVTGQDSDVLTGEELRDRPVIARDRVRYQGEIVAVVVADTEAQAKGAADAVRVRYEPLPVVHSPAAALRPDAPILHERLGEYVRGAGVIPIPGTNVASVIRIAKGDMEQGWAESEIVVDNRVTFGPSDHAAMETRSAICEIRPDGHIVIESSTQVPFAVKKYIASYFGIDSGFIIVKTPFVGGAYGGKTAIHLEPIAYLASRAVGGRKVKLVNTREEDMVTSPGRIGLDAVVRLGSTRDGRIQAAQILYHFDGGAYNDKSSDVARAAAADCSGPYAIRNLHCECLTVYTNHTFPAAFRGYGHSELTMAMERAIDKLADTLGMDPWDVRMINSIKPGDIAPTRDRLTRSNLGDIQTCLRRLKELSDWESSFSRVDDYKVRATGISCFWKNSSIDSDAGSGAILLFNPDGSVNLETGVVEIGTGTKTVLAQMVAERFGMSVDRVHVKFAVNTLDTPEHWKTVASRGTFMAGRAALKAADDAIRQLKDIAAAVLKVVPEDLAIGGEKVFLRDDPSLSIPVKDICYGYKYPNGHAIGGQIIGRGVYIQRRIEPLNPLTGEGTPGPEWGVGAQAVEIELDLRDCSYRLLRSISVIDAGRVLNLKGALGQVMGASAMGLSYASREAFYYNADGQVLDPTLRDYTLMRYGENPAYTVEFIENPCLEAPFGARALGEHGLIGMPAALASAVSRAAGVRLNVLPLFPETVWRARNGGEGTS
ncbi:xanthine dehydrogenase family protein molybdopterin-binding subunit [Cohnella lubricantis]|uniref:Xanthine dehydrogenase family protein molybdopterin-binding subunit n=1 Tax=Cohnella lubricantis TaxID=2163172 RepID=A0A841TDY5_9BACL|nr:xanthine dehydrogenase family protein molybdopterin-binding subunit [Cohnella lubricantis]MBB6678446.1 xanthine dehydrogenase family protein molybdopterin-binding subunit [Cohnella lubricantis]MBP2116826.1 CO/xanthine dehydrogenase Mo-binding subunit [Cohnella lubricantis]